ncbi:MAG: hypothetical protein KJ941_10435, partial [Bacteroidetes bacterium]|nr:hypothetical protein [Bacteroidota bacterium]
MSVDHKGHTQPAIDQDEHTHISGVGGKKVFVIDNAGNQITQFGSATVTQIATNYSIYENTSCASGYNFYGFTTPGSNPTTANFKIMR